jgi:hypothetical protein
VALAVIGVGVALAASLLASGLADRLLPLFA